MSFGNQGTGFNNPSVLIANQVYVFGNKDGIFVYSGQPALGNPPIFYVGSASKDKYGNTLQANTLTDSGLPILIYSGTPAAGNLIVAFSPTAGSDSFGNTYGEGVTVKAGSITGVTISGSAFDGTDFRINSSGAFFYSGTPAAGNLIASVASASGNDAFGNPYLQGITSYFGTGTSALVAQLANGTATFNDPGQVIAFTATIGIDAATGDCLITSGDKVVRLDSGTSIVASNGTVAEPWHNLPAPALGSVAGYARYKMLADSKLVMVQIQNWVPPATKPTDGTAIWAAGSLPAAYQPAQYPPFRPGYSQNIGTETPAISVRTNGAIQVFGLGGTSSTRCDWDIIYPLD